MEEILDHEKVNTGENLTPAINFVVVRNWDKTVESLQQQAGLEVMALRMGFDLPTLIATLNREFPVGLAALSEYNPTGEKTEDIVVETIIVNGRPLDRLLVTGYPPAAHPRPTEMTKFKSGGEVILVTEGEAEITYAQGGIGKVISRSDLRSTKVGKGDLIISTDTPNNWTRVLGDKFSFIYFVGNPNGPQKYGDIPKEKIPVK